jgi:hypothetical protein
MWYRPPITGQLRCCCLAVIDGAGHGLYASEPAQYNAELITFAQSLGVSTA